MATKPKVIFVTGTSRGIGKAIAEELRDQGHIVYGCSRNQADIAENHLKLDVTDPDACSIAIAKIIGAEGHIDAIINNVGYHLVGASEETSIDEIRNQFEVNFFGALNVIKAATPHFVKQKSGHIVSLTSLPGRVALPFMSAYCASKYALEGYTRSLRPELLPFNVHVANVIPGAVESGTTDQSVKVTATPSELFEPLRHGVTEVIRTGQHEDAIPVADVVQATVDVISNPNPDFTNLVGKTAIDLIGAEKSLPEADIEAMIRGITGLPHPEEQASEGNA